MKEIDDSRLVAFLPNRATLNAIDRPPVYGDWEELIHPLGGTYYYNNKKVSAKCISNVSTLRLSSRTHIHR
jgi:hypothetical protein